MLCYQVIIFALIVHSKFTFLIKNFILINLIKKKYYFLTLLNFIDGGAYCMGSIKDDRWYLYIINNPQAPPTCADHSLEILMNDMPNEILKIFTKTKYQTGEECTRVFFYIIKFRNAV